MGTNYYLHDKLPCPTCGHGGEPRHIGKSSAGWCFSLRIYPEDGINDLEDWLPLLRKDGAVIKDEYGGTVEASALLANIKDRVWSRGGNQVPRGYADWDDFYRKNHSQPGPNGLMRHLVDGRHCVKNGAGTWDCIVGEFS